MERRFEGFDVRSQPEQRSEDRSMTVFRPVLIETEGFAGFCLVRNISSNGIMGHVYTAFEEGAKITLEFGSNLRVSGQVKWCRDGFIGVQFDESVFVSDVLNSMSSTISRGRVARPPRLEIHCEGELLAEGRAQRFELRDISQKGMKIAANFLRPDEEVLVMLNGLQRRKAVVRWVKGGEAGLNFIIALPFEELAEWVIWRNTENSRVLPRQLIA